MTHSVCAIYKIFSPDDWETLRRNGETDGSALDRADGFLHFSTAAQLPGTLAAHYRDAGDLMLAEVPVTTIPDRDLRWETSRGGDKFPHLYTPLRKTDIARYWLLHPNEDGHYALPELHETDNA